MWEQFRGLHMWKGGAPFLLSPLSLLLFGGLLPPSFFVWDAPIRERRRRGGRGFQPDRQRRSAGEQTLKEKSGLHFCPSWFVCCHVLVLRRKEAERLRVDFTEEPKKT